MRFESKEGEDIIIMARGILKFLKNRKQKDRNIPRKSRSILVYIKRVRQKSNARKNIPNNNPSISSSRSRRRSHGGVRTSNAKSGNTSNTINSNSNNKKIQNVVSSTNNKFKHQSSFSERSISNQIKDKGNSNTASKIERQKIDRVKKFGISSSKDLPAYIVSTAERGASKFLDFTQAVKIQPRLTPGQQEGASRMIGQGSLWVAASPAFVTRTGLFNRLIKNVKVESNIPRVFKRSLLAPVLRISSTTIPIAIAGTGTAQSFNTPKTTTIFIDDGIPGIDDGSPRFRRRSSRAAPATSPTEAIVIQPPITSVTTLISNQSGDLPNANDTYNDMFKQKSLSSLKKSKPKKKPRKKLRPSFTGQVLDLKIGLPKDDLMIGVNPFDIRGLPRVKKRKKSKKKK